MWNRKLRPSLSMTPASYADAAHTRTVVILLPGGRANDRSRLRTPRLPSVRMIPFDRALRRATAGRGVAIWRLRYRYRGWNGPHHDPLSDLEWALTQVRRLHPGATAVLVGHSLGGRAALLGAGDPSVVGVCGLAPWLEPGDPVAQVSGRVVLIAHGESDRTTDPVLSRRFALAARSYTPDVRWVRVNGDGHAMLRQPGTWTRLVTNFVVGLTN